MKQIISLILLTLTSALYGADMNVMVILDTSGSMNDRLQNSTRLDIAKQTLYDTLSQLPDSTNIGIITFNGIAYEFGSIDKQKLNIAITKQRANGGTPLWKYIKIGADKLLEARKANNNIGVYKILIVTDGAADPGDENLLYLEDIKSRGIIMDAIGLGMRNNHPLSTQINGSYMRGDDASSLKQSIQSSVAEIAFTDKNIQFEELEIPENFANHVITSLTTFSNHPIGTEPPKISIKPKESSNNANTILKESPQQPKGMPVSILVILSVLTVILVLICFTYFSYYLKEE